MNGAAAARRSSLAWGFRSLGQWRLILLLAAATILLALPAAFALWPSLHSVFGQTLAGDQVLRNHPFFAPAQVLEFAVEKRDALSAARQSALAGVGLAVLLQIFFAGGFVEVLARRDRARVGPFFEGAFRNFWHNLKCFALFAISAAILLGLWLGVTGAAAGKAFEDAVPSAAAPRFTHLAMYAGALLLFAALSLLHDFARIARRFDPDIGAWRGFGTARRILSGSWLRAFGLLLFWLILGGGVWIAVLAVEWATPAVSAAAIFLHTLLQAGAVVVRSAVRVAGWGSYVALADARAADIAAVRTLPRHSPETEAPATRSPEPLPPFGQEPSIPRDPVGESPLL